MKNRASLIFLLLFFSLSSFPQKNTEQISILFYNVENLFDTKNDPHTEDDEFTPEGDRHWTYKRFNQKLLNISKVILSASGWNVPAIIALCEIENRYVLDKLLTSTPLKSYSYKIIHKESPDHRGTDVAFIYSPQQFYPIEYKHYPIKDKNNLIMKSREILYVSGILNKADTVHFFVNHWPSRYGGLLETRGIRNTAATLLREKVDDLFETYNSPKIIILGDFNDQPTDESLKVYLYAKEVSKKVAHTDLYNLSFNWKNKFNGTLKYHAQWDVFDQIIVSGSLLNASSGLVTKLENANILNYPFLFEKDEKYGGMKPKRTYYGFSYLGGFSDHLPVLLKLEKEN